MNKTQQLQIRITEREKQALKKAAREAHMNISELVMAALFPPLRMRFQNIVQKLNDEDATRFVFAELNDFLTALTKTEFVLATSDPHGVALSAYPAHYVAAMVEWAAYQKKCDAPRWTAEYEGLEKPVFGNDMQSLRLHLLVASPPPFRKRNIFIDASIGDRV